MTRAPSPDWGAAGKRRDCGVADPVTTTERWLGLALAELPSGAVRALRAEQLPGWRLQAACIGRDPELWFPPKGQTSTPEAVRVCAGCPVSRPCLAAALLVDEQYGVWGGHGRAVRRVLRRALENGEPAGAVLDAAALVTRPTQAAS